MKQKWNARLEMFSLNATAKLNGIRLRFVKDGRCWSALHPNGRVAWCGSLKEIRRIAKGLPLIF